MDLTGAPSIKQRLRLISTSGPLLSLLFVGVTFLVLPIEAYGPGHDTLFDVSAPQVWGAVATPIALAGFYGLLAHRQVWWLIAHSFAVFFLLLLGAGWAIQFFKTGVGGPENAGLCLGAALNAWARSSPTYKEPFSGRKKP